VRNLPKRLWRRVKKRIRLFSHSSAADCFLISYPKSGRTWFRFILSHYFSNAAGLNVDVNLHNMFSVLPNFDLDTVRGVPAFGFATHQPKIPFIPVSHLGYRRSLFLSRPVIFMIRDPRDVIVSAYFHATRHKHRFQGSMSDFIMDREQGLPALVRYLNNWSDGLRRRSHIILSYEDLSLDAESETAKILTFLGCEINSSALKKAVEAGRFGAMQEREISEGLPAHDYDRTDSESLRMRRGQAGGYGDYLNAEQISDIEKFCSQALTAEGKMLVAKTGMTFSS
jgi:alcohol sulfotransferase